MKKVLIFAERPMTLWNASALLMILAFRVIDIRFFRTALERQNACDRFNDKNEPVSILLTSLRITTASVNLNKDCIVIMCIDISVVDVNVLQAIERVYRIE